MSNPKSEVNNNQINIGTIEVITGPMFSGKTESLIKQLHLENTQAKKVICLKPSIDDRYHKNKIVSQYGWGKMGLMRRMNDRKLLFSNGRTIGARLI